MEERGKKQRVVHVEEDEKQRRQHQTKPLFKNEAGTSNEVMKRLWFPTLLCSSKCCYAYSGSGSSNWPGQRLNTFHFVPSGSPFALLSDYQRQFECSNNALHSCSTRGCFSTDLHTIIWCVPACSLACTSTFVKVQLCLCSGCRKLTNRHALTISLNTATADSLL